MSTDSTQGRSEPEPKAKANPLKDLLFVVSRQASNTYSDLKRIFADTEWVAVIFDRRSGERRGPTSLRDPESRRADRRSQPLIDDRLRRQGWVMVRRQRSRDTPDRN